MRSRPALLVLLAVFACRGGGDDATGDTAVVDRGPSRAELHPLANALAAATGMAPDSLEVIDRRTARVVYVNTPDATVGERARERRASAIARIVWSRYGNAAGLKTVTVVFVRTAMQAGERPRVFTHDFDRDTTRHR